VPQSVAQLLRQDKVAPTVQRVAEMESLAYFLGHQLFTDDF
jgi:hypothetical protein